MSEVWFYHLDRHPLEAALPLILEKTLERGWRAIVRAGSAERLEMLDNHLWVWRTDSFLPHGRRGDPYPEHHPVYLTTGTENPNRAQALVIIDRAEFPEIAGDGLSAFARAMVLFNGRDEAALGEARAHWKAAQAAGRDTAYWQQTPQGGWSRAR
jgi:DNA polymerase-3 subunit chi